MTGRQEPTFEVVGEWQETNGGEAVALFESYGFHFDYAQRREMDIYLARIDGKPAAVTVGLSIPRQNGKSYAARWYAIWCAAILGLVVLYSAHNGDTITEFFTMVTSIFEDEENYPDFAEMLDGAPYRQPGKESIRFKSGGRIRFMTRTNNKSRSSTCDVLVMDEAQELTDAQLNAILPVVSAGPHGMPQIIYIGTPPDTTCPGTVFRRMHDRAHSDNPGKAWWMEWAVDSVPPEDATKQQLMELAYMTNPALGVRITEGAVENEIDSMSRDGFARERHPAGRADVPLHERHLLRARRAQPVTGVRGEFRPAAVAGDVLGIDGGDQRLRSSGEEFPELPRLLPLPHGNILPAISSFMSSMSSE